MNYIIDLENVKHTCRVCLAPSNQMIALSCKLDEENDESPEICNALENIFSTKVNIASNYPEGVCIICYRKIKVSYELMITFNNSQTILENYISLLANSDDCDNTDSSQNGDLLDDTLDILSEDDIKQEFIEEEDDTKHELIEQELPISDYVILQITDDNEDDMEMKQEKTDTEEDYDKAEESESVNTNITAEFLDPNKYTIEKISPMRNLMYKCQLCKKLMLTKRELDQHTKICQNDSFQKCEFCGQQFSSRLRKHYHIKMKHNNGLPKEVICDTCNEVFDNQKARTYHMKTKHASKEFDCKICGKAFHFKNGLATHMDTHSKDKFKEVCPECGKGFHYRGGLFYHMKVHRDERNYLCTYCSARFLNVSGLKKHIRIHTGEKPCQCEYCGKSFRSTSILKKHEKIHTGHRPHSCKVCKKGFISTYNLKVHMAGHSGDHPCVFCDKTLLNEEVLKLHLKFKHNVKEGDIQKDDSD